jgi:16S rRNA G966 N2-methylase RsmD
MSGSQLVLEVDDPRAPVRARKATSLYGVHSYHTKVPPSAIEGFIERYSEPGDVVLDVFCGSGMTGVAAASMGRRAELFDLSPAAVHIARNYTAPCSPRAFRESVERVLARVGETISALYASSHDGQPATIEYLVWSDVRACPSCGKHLTLWEQRASGLRALTCDGCGHQGAKSTFAVVGERPVEANLSTRDGRVVRPASEADLNVGQLPERLGWYPNEPFDASRPMWRRGHEELGINSVDQFYSRRNLTALAWLWDAAGQEPDLRLREALRFSLTAIANRASRRYQWNAKRPTNVLGGTLYVSSLRYEWNVLSLWRRKTAAVERLFVEHRPPEGAVRVRQGSATSLALPDDSIDYCFTDPPFGAHIVYSDVSLLWEAWLQDFTDRGSEAIVVAGGDHPKKVADYQGLLTAAFAEIRRVLKPTGAATVVFQATDAAVWSAMLDAATAAGLIAVEATTLDKGQPSFKQIRAQTAGEHVATHDVVFTLRPVEAVASRIESGVTAHDVLVEVLGEDPRGTDAGAIYAACVARSISQGIPYTVSLREVRAALRDRANAAAEHELVPVMG